MITGSTEQVRQRAEVLEALLFASDHFAGITEIVRNSESPVEARGALIQKFGIGERQAQVMLEFQVAGLCAGHRAKVKDELEAIEEYLSENAEG